MAEPTKVKMVMPLRTVADLVEAHEWMFHQQRNGQIDAKTADAMNTTLKGQTYLVAKLGMEAAKLYLNSQIKKVIFPDGLLPLMLGK